MAITKERFAQVANEVREKSEKLTVNALSECLKDVETLEEMTKIINKGERVEIYGHKDGIKIGAVKHSTIKIFTLR